MSQVHWYHFTVKDLQAPFTYYWVSGTGRVWKSVVTKIKKEGNRWITNEGAGLDFSLAERDGIIVIPFSDHTHDLIFNNYWMAYAYSLKVKDAA